jgi:hypothetical protein
MLLLHERFDSLPCPRAPGVKCVASRIGKPFSPIDFRNLDDLVACLNQSLNEVVTPKAISGKRVPLETLQTAEKYAHLEKLESR